MLLLCRSVRQEKGVWDSKCSVCVERSGTIKGNVIGFRMGSAEEWVLWESVNKHLLVIKHNVGQPDVFRRNVQLGNSAILRWIPFQLVVLPLLLGDVQHKHKNYFGKKQKFSRVVTALYTFLVHFMHI